MDSLTQIVLGAACGEIALGKKIGNKALLFGAIGGIIKDLDVFTGMPVKTSKSFMMPPMAPNNKALFPIFLPSAISPQAAPKTI